MSKFYGSVVGNTGVATRGGTAKSGIKTSNQSYNGSIITTMYEDDGNLMIRIDYSPESSSHGNTVFTGTIEEYLKKLEAWAWM